MYDIVFSLCMVLSEKQEFFYIERTFDRIKSSFFSDTVVAYLFLFSSRLPLDFVGVESFGRAGSSLTNPPRTLDNSIPWTGKQAVYKFYPGRVTLPPNIARL